MHRYRKLLYFFLSCIVTLALECRFEICVGGFAGSRLLNGINKLYCAFNRSDYTDLLALAAVYMLFCAAEAGERKFDLGAGILALVFAVLLVVCTSFKKFNHAGFLVDNLFQALLSGFCIIGYGILFYLALCLLFRRMEGGAAWSAGDSVCFLPVGFGIIFLCWLPWILLNYPGTECGDGVRQLGQFLGDADWSAAHPPLSSMVMGVLFALGRDFADANLGFFLYCLLQTVIGAWAFAFAMWKLRQLGMPVKWCMAGIFFFALSPLWGIYAQWVEKDLLYTEVIVLQAVYMLEVINGKSCRGKAAFWMTFFGILATLLRNNGVYAIVPALFLLAFWLKGVERGRVFLSLAITLVVYKGVTAGLYPAALGTGQPPLGETFNIPFQQTARYVCEYGDEVTGHEREVIGAVLHYDALEDYDPVISDPVRIHYMGGDLTEYCGVWLQMFWKHPGCYVSAFINKCYGYLAPVEQNIEAWIGLEYSEYMEGLGIHHVFAPQASRILEQVWHLSQTLPLVKYLCTPGLYTWITLALAFLLWRRRQFGALILFVPSLMNILVCLASPMASAIRYELPTVAMTPILIGWSRYALQKRTVCINGS